MTPFAIGVSEAVDHQVRDVIAMTLDLEGDLPAGLSQSDCPRWTSLRHMVLMMQLEETFGLTFSTEDMIAMTSLEAISNLINDRLDGRREILPLMPAKPKPAALVDTPSETPPETESRVGGLPRPAREYLRSPKQTLRKLGASLNARWQLRRANHVGSWTQADGRIHVFNHGDLLIGSRVQIHSTCAACVLAVFPGGRLEIGDRTVLNYGTDIAATQLVRIGDDCLIGTHVCILDNDFHETASHEQSPPANPVLIGDQVWIGNRAMVLPGVTVGDGAVIGAGSVVIADVPARSLAMGNPARIIKRW